jgi:hypothetical protein
MGVGVLIYLLALVVVPPTAIQTLSTHSSWCTLRFITLLLLLLKIFLDHETQDFCFVLLQQCQCDDLDLDFLWILKAFDN